jgi:hypothetical protein
MDRAGFPIRFVRPTTRCVAKFCRAAIAGVTLFTLAATTANATELALPDLFPWKDYIKSYMYGGFVVVDEVPGKTVYRFSLPMPNIGTGPLELREETDAADTQTIYQRIFDTNGNLAEERVVGVFPNANPPYGHMFFEGVADYRIRELLPDDGVGAVLTTHEKISYALVDGDEYDLSLPGAPASSHYDSVSDPLVGISVGYADVYSYQLPGQWADVTGLPSGEYWLEVEVDPFNRILEADETNNVDRVKIDIFVPEPEILAGDYNRDGLVDAVDYTVWRNTLGQIVPHQGDGADGDGSRRVGVPDYGVWKSHYGETDAGSGAGGLAIPEPTLTTVALAAFIAYGLARPVHRRTVAPARS